MSEYNGLILNDANGIEITLNAFKYHMGNFGPVFITIIITLFGLSTVWAGYYYGEASLKFMKKTTKIDIIILKWITILILIFGSIVPSQKLWSLTDVMVGVLAIINIYAIFSLRSIVVEEYKFWKNNYKKRYIN